jgi:hypothetical protein
MTTMNRVWVSGWDAALGDQKLRDQQARRYTRWGAQLRPHVVTAQRLGELRQVTDTDSVVAMAAAFTHGLVATSRNSSSTPGNR